MDTFFAYMSILVFAFAWYKMFRKSILDDTRDKLFDLRDGTRAWFIEEGYGVDHPTYHSLRRLLNSHIRHTESINLIRYLTVVNMFKTDNEFREYVDDTFASEFNTDDPRLRVHTATIRERATSIIQVHIATSSLLIVTLAILAAPCVILKIAVSSFVAFCKERSVMLVQANRRALATAIACSLVLLPWRVMTMTDTLGRYFTQENIEKYSAS